MKNKIFLGLLSLVAGLSLASCVEEPLNIPTEPILNESSNDYVEIPGLRFPKGYIRGSVGAGDAFCSGALIAIEHGASDAEILELAEAAAVASLTAQDATSGILCKAELLANIRKFER